MDALINADEVAALLGVRPSTVRDAAWRGKLPCVRLWQGKRRALVRFRREDIEELIRSSAVPASPDQGRRD